MTTMLLVILILFEGIIIQCEGNTREPGESSSHVIIEIEDPPPLPQHLLQLISEKNSAQTSKTGVREKIKSELAMSELWTKPLVYIDLHSFDDRARGVYRNGGRIEFGSIDSIFDFFKNFGKHVKKIEINLTGLSDIALRKEFNQKVFKENAKYFEELKYEDQDYYPGFFNVTLEDCFEDVTGLKKLELRTHPQTIGDRTLVPLIRNNKDLTNLFVDGSHAGDITALIANELPNLMIFGISNPGNLMICQTDGNLLSFYTEYAIDEYTIHEFPSVRHFSLEFDDMENISGKLSIKMPELRTLRFSVLRPNSSDSDRIVTFIRHFGVLERVELILLNDRINQYCIKKIKNVKELTVYCNVNGQLLHLKEMFESFDETSELQRLKVISRNARIHPEFVKTMKKVMDRLVKAPEKSTWTLSHDEITIGSSIKRIMLTFERHSSTSSRLSINGQPSSHPSCPIYETVGPKPIDLLMK